MHHEVRAEALELVLDRPFVVVPLQQLAGKFLMSMKEYPPSQTPGSFNLEKIQKQIEAGARQ